MTQPGVSKNTKLIWNLGVYKWMSEHLMKYFFYIFIFENFKNIQIQN